MKKYIYNYLLPKYAGNIEKAVKSRILIGLKLRHSGKYTPVSPAANSYGKILANVDVKSNSTYFMRTDSKKFFSVSEQKRNHKKNSGNKAYNNCLFREIPPNI